MQNDSYLFNPDDWFTPNTYDTNYKEPSNKSGVYLLVKPNIEFNVGVSFDILYVGSAKDLKVRYTGHEVLRVLKEVYGYIQFYFKEELNYRDIEKNLIKSIQPKFNKQWR